MFNDNGSFLLALFEFFLFFAWFMCLFWVLGDIFRSKDLGGVAKTFWVLFVILIPWLGILVYVIARGKGMQERQLEQARDMQAAQTDYIKSVAGATSADGPDRVGQGAARQRCHHPGRVRRAQGQGARQLTWHHRRVAAVSLLGTRSFRASVRRQCSWVPLCHVDPGCWGCRRGGALPAVRWTGVE